MSLPLVPHRLVAVLLLTLARWRFRGRLLFERTLPYFRRPTRWTTWEMCFRVLVDAVPEGLAMFVEVRLAEERRRSFGG